MGFTQSMKRAIQPFSVGARRAQERLRTGVAWWPLSCRYVADPYPVYNKLRERDPVLQEGYVEMTRPDAPSAANQQYRLTERGEASASASECVGA